MLFWAALLVYPLTFGDIYNESAYTLVNITQQACFFLCVLSFICSHDNRKASALLLMGVYSLYAVVMDAIFNEVTSLFYLLESLLFFTWAIVVMTRYERKTLPNIDYDNILLAFYRGENGSFLMRFFELFGISVQSVAVIAGDKCLILKKSSEGFQFKNSDIILKKKENYLIVDTKKKSTPEFICNMQGHEDKKARLWGFRICCIQGISTLLEAISPKFKPKGILSNSPSIYLGQIDG